MAGLEAEKGTDDFTVVLVLETNYDGHGDGRVSYETLFDLERVDVFATCVTLGLAWRKLCGVERKWWMDTYL